MMIIVEWSLAPYVLTFECHWDLNDIQKWKRKELDFIQNLSNDYQCHWNSTNEFLSILSYTDDWRNVEKLTVTVTTLS